MRTKELEKRPWNRHAATTATPAKRMVSKLLSGTVHQVKSSA